jgi:hypothetical protein
MQTQAFQLTLYLPDDAAQPAVALPKPDRAAAVEIAAADRFAVPLGDVVGWNPADCDELAPGVQ